MQHPFLVADILYLRGLERSDLASDYFQWLNDYDVTKYLESGRFPNTVEAMELYFASKANSQNDVIFAIVDRVNDSMIGTVKLGNINWLHRHAEFAIMIGDKNYWGKGYGKTVTCLMLAYGFYRLNLNKIILGVVADHINAIHVYEKAGFQREGILKDMLYVDGSYCDKIIMGITRKQYDILNKEN